MKLLTIFACTIVNAMQPQCFSKSSSANGILEASKRAVTPPNAHTNANANNFDIKAKHALEKQSNPSPVSTIGTFPQPNFNN